MVHALNQTLYEALPGAVPRGNVLTMSCGSPYIGGLDEYSERRFKRILSVLTMPQHKSAAKRMRQSERKRTANRLHRSRIRTMMKKLRAMDSKDEAVTFLSDVKAYLDRLASKRIIHKNKAANYKSELEKGVNAL